MTEKLLFITLFLGLTNCGLAQLQIAGKIIDTESKSPLAYVNIGIKHKNLGTVSKEDGSFIITVPHEYQSDSLTFSIVGYHESTSPIQDLVSGKKPTIELKQKTTQLQDLVIAGEKLVEKKYGIKSRGPIHFTDGMFKKDDSFEIGQVIRLGNSLAQITSLNLRINSSRADSATFRINFYRYDTNENNPKERIVEKSLLQRHPINEGWLKFDLSDYNILLKGDVLVSLQFIPETEKEVQQILYDVKLGGSSKSFCRRTSLGQWTRPPHHYCLYVTAITEKNAPDDPVEKEATPAFTLKSDFSSEPYSIFVRLPKKYPKQKKQTYPVIYLLDGNAYFDAVANSVDNYSKEKKISSDPIVVGIGYENAYVMDSLRNRDYTYPEALAADSFKISGRGDKFYNFIETKLIPYIDSAYRTDKTNRTIMGHSFGGYFVLYALTRHLTEQSVFNNFIAASPSIYYHDYYLMEEIDKFSDMKNTENTKVYLTIGERELQEYPSDDFKRMSEILTDNAIDVQSEVYKNQGHMGTAIPTFENGVQMFMNEQDLNKK